MSIWNKFKRKFKSKPKEQLDPELKAWGYEIILEQLLKAMDPDNYKVEKTDHGHLIYERYIILDENKEDSGEYEWKRRYSSDHDGDKVGYFKTHSKAITAIQAIIKKAAKDFDKVKKEIENA